MLSSFFDYPDQSDGEQSRELVFLPQWDDARWATLLKYTELRRFQAGDAVIRQGDTDRAFYIIIDGKLEVLIPHGASGKLRQTQVREAGAVIGEQCNSSSTIPSHRRCTDCPFAVSARNRSMLRGRQRSPLSKRSTGLNAAASRAAIIGLTGVLSRTF